MPVSLYEILPSLSPEDAPEKIDEIDGFGSLQPARQVRLREIWGKLEPARRNRILSNINHARDNINQSTWMMAEIGEPHQNKTLAEIASFVFPT